ncbi:hypothetical protein [Streptomyces anulatus]|uniref:hypothetical protein n=1 Tax=Streptomyces anulatus TaxID=1892 RepID=UPI002255A1D7|nr:hypothetical protein [Streptomyces anulatus]MCX4504559.1 hypothetical protein [Streptomyces anulatus]
MAARVEQQAPQSDSPARTSSSQERTEVTLTAMSVQFPGLIHQVTVPAGEA